MYALVAATFLSIAPTPYDHLAADADLTTPAGSPPLTDRSPRARVALLAAMARVGALDHDAPELRWFGPGLAWGSELDHARRLAARVRECPEEPGFVPPREWFAAESAAHTAAAAAWRRRAAEYRERAEWEPDRLEALTTWARHMEATGDAHGEMACRYAGWAGNSWQRPRRVVLAECRDWLGPLWDRREWPE